MIKSIKDLEAIKNKMAASLYLKNPNPQYTVIFNYNEELKEKGADTLIDYTIKTLLDLNRLDVVVMKVYKEEAKELSLTVKGETLVTNYEHLTKEVIDLIIKKHLVKGDK